MDLAFLKQKKWGLPVWAWAVIVSVVIFGLYYWYRKRSSSSNSSANTTTASPDNSNVPLTQFPYDPGGGSSGGDSGGYRGYSAPLPVVPPNITIEIPQPNGGGATTSTTPPSSPSSSLTTNTPIFQTGGEAISGALGAAGITQLKEAPASAGSPNLAEGLKQLNSITQVTSSQPPIKTVSTSKTVPSTVPKTTPIFQPIKPVISKTTKPLY